MSASFGAFGKMPGLGDFLRLNLPADFIQAWDGWLQQAMVAAREALGGAWNAAYMSAPIWRFTLPPGAAGAEAVSGILMASIDRVGRQYPLTLAVRHDGSMTALSHFSNRQTFEALEHIALAALDDRATRDSLSEAMAQVAWAAPTHTVMINNTYVGTHSAAQTMAADHIYEACGDCALWTTAMEGDHRMMLTGGLPQGPEALGLFDLNATVWHGRGARGAS